jgi:hypothetical protein
MKRTVAPPRYGHVRLQISGLDPSFLPLFTRAVAAMRQANIEEAEVTKFKRLVLGGNQHRLVATCMKWFDCR